MAFVKVTPYKPQKKQGPSLVGGAPGMEMVQGDPMYLNTDFIAGVLSTEAVNSQIKIPDNSAIILLHDGSNTPVVGTPEEVTRRIKNAITRAP